MRSLCTSLIFEQGDYTLFEAGWVGDRVDRNDALVA
jgi:thiamine pyrophosphokinase